MNTTRLWRVAVNEEGGREVSAALASAGENQFRAQKRRLRATERPAARVPEPKKELTL